MKLLLALTLSCFVVAASAAADELVPLTSSWKKTVYAFTISKLKHSAWGPAHSRRDYALSLALAKREGLVVDEEVLFAAAMLHDMGGFDEFKKEGVDHAVRSAEICETVLGPAGFPTAKLAAVKEAILAHTYYNPKPPVTFEGQVLHDADTIDFLGIIGLERIVSLTERDAVAPSLPAAVKLVDKLASSLADRVVGPQARVLARERATELKAALHALSVESFGGRAL